jgi:hypothetical protein
LPERKQVLNRISRKSTTFTSNTSLNDSDYFSKLHEDTEEIFVESSSDEDNDFSQYLNDDYLNDDIITLEKAHKPKLSENKSINF